ncbi:MAG TPA: DddA-like double-stranded DNA deaminase toxin, partial [Clostridia bacterium]
VPDKVKDNRVENGVEPKAIENPKESNGNSNSNTDASEVNTTPKLPEFSGKKTSGVLVPKNPPGEPIPIDSGNVSGARFPYSQADGHVETKGALIMNENGILEADIYHNNPNGTCPNCDRYLPTYLNEGSKLTVYPPENAVPKTPNWKAEPKTYTGNNKSPYSK